MATKIVTKNSSTASAVPTASDLVQGELAVNVADKRLFTEDNGGSIVELGTNPSTLTVTGEITANGGIDVTGTATMDGLTVDNITIDGNEIDVSSGDLTLDVAGDIILDSDGNVGIGTNLPSAPLDVVSASSSTGLNIRGRSSDNIGSLYFTSNASASTEYGYIQGRSTDLRIQGLNNGLILQPTSGNVGIGVDVPDSLLHIKKTTADAKVTLETSESYDCYINFSGATSEAAIGYNATDNALLFCNPAGDLTTGEAMRIDVSGNLLVGLSSTSGIATGSTADNGVYVDGSVGAVVAQSSANKNLYLSKASGYSDPDFISFQVNGTTVGSIGVTSGSLGIGQSNTGLGFFNTDSIVFPATAAGATRDNAIDLGYSGGRFKDLYLSGGVSTNTATGLSITANSSNRGILNLSTSTAYQLIGGSYYGYMGYKTGGYHRFFGSDGVEDMRIDSSGNLLVGTTQTDVGYWYNRFGCVIESGGQLHSAVSGDACAIFNRNTNDGEIVELRQGGSKEGSISVSGSTVSYNGFAGRHESSGISLSTKKGTVVSTIDELDTYLSGVKQGQTRADHAKVKVSDIVGDSCVYGVVDGFTDEGKVNVISVGIGAVCVTGSCAKGDLLESNGDGTARVQPDDIVRNKTIGKVTIGNNDTNAKLVSCVLYCG